MPRTTEAGIAQRSQWRTPTASEGEQRLARNQNSDDNQETMVIAWSDARDNDAQSFLGLSYDWSSSCFNAVNAQACNSRCTRCTSRQSSGQNDHRSIHQKPNTNSLRKKDIFMKKVKCANIERMLMRHGWCDDQSQPEQRIFTFWVRVTFCTYHDTSTANHHIPTTNYKISTPSHDISTPNLHISTPNLHRSTPNRNTSTPNPSTSMPNPNISMQNPDIPMQNPNTSMRNDFRKTAHIAI